MYARHRVKAVALLTNLEGPDDRKSEFLNHVPRRADTLLKLPQCKQCVFENSVITFHGASFDFAGTAPRWYTRIPYALSLDIIPMMPGLVLSNITARPALFF